ncbi:MAG: HAMP domain-containing sensor histidine kinase [Oryzihumus sp.]
MRTRAPSLRRLSLRARLLLIGVAGVAVALALGSAALYGVLVVTVNHTIDAEARASAADVVALVDSGRLSSPIPVAGAQVVQVVDGSGRVVSASVNADRLTPLLRPAELRQALAGQTTEVPGARAGVNGPLRAVAVRAGPAATPVSVVVALQVGDVTQSQRVLLRTLVLTYPLLLLVLAAIAWRVIGSALRPVEELRAGAERISGSGHDERLPVPASADEIHALALTLNGMLDRLDAARERQRGFVADAAHELRSPLASMRTQLEVAERLGEGGALPAELLADVARLTRLVEDLLLLARADSSVAPPQRESFDAAALLTDVADRYAGSRVPVSVTSGAGPVPVRGDREELRRALTNLVDNAVRHARSRVVLAARAPIGAAVLTVTDDGPGIPEALRENVFERFTRLDDARDRDAGGTGLGLAIVRELVRRSGGSVRLLDADPPPGLCVELVFPHAR